MKHYGLSTEAVRWFRLHGEVDVKHTEEGKQVLSNYISFYKFTTGKVDEILNATFRGNFVLARYLPTSLGRAAKATASSIQQVEILPLCIPFNSTFAHSLASRQSSDAVIVRVRDADGVTGYGEGLPRPYVTGEDVASMVTALEYRLAPQVLGLTFQPGIEAIDQVRAMIDGWSSSQVSSPNVMAWHATLCAMELALLDWAFKRAGESLSLWLAPARSEVVYSGVVDAADLKVTQAATRRYHEAGITIIKVKVGIGDDLQRLELVRRVGGDEVRIRVDANAAWNPTQAIAALRAMEPWGIEAVEQPVAPSDLEGMRQVREGTGIPVVADESLVTLENARSLVREQACDIFNVRVSKCGGLINSIAIAELGLAAGVKIQIGAQVGETSLLSAAGRHLAAYLRQVEYVESSFGTHLLQEDVTTSPVMFGYGGLGELLLGPGLGVDVNDGVLERLATRIVRVGG